MKIKKKKGILIILLEMGLIPIVIIAIVLAILSDKEITKALEKSVYERLRVAATGLEQYYTMDLAANGEITYDHEYVDQLKSDDIELTLFLGDTRVLTSIKSDNGERNEGSPAAAGIWTTVSSGSDYYSDGVNIAGRNYYVYYVPFTGADGSVVGMAFAGEPQDQVRNTISKIVMQIVVVAIVIAILLAGIVITLALNIRRTLTGISDATGVLSQGDLTQNIEVNSSIKEIDQLVCSASSLQKNISEVISKVHSQAGEINSAMGDVADATDTCNQAADGITGAITELSKGSMEMAESVQNIASNMSDMGEDINEVAELAASTSETVSKVKDVSVEAKNKLSDLVLANAKTAEISGEVARGIEESNEAVVNIREAAETIASIASQTNLLALNASIEAARAGEAGKGFAVVADNIKNLAAQSDASASEIQVVINDIIAKSEHNVSLAGQIKDAVQNEGDVLSEVGEGFNHVETGIELSTDAMAQVTDKVSNINIVKEKVLDEISTLSSIAEENAASTEETNASMEEMAANIAMIQGETSSTKDRAEELNNAVAFFRV